MRRPLLWGRRSRMDGGGRGHHREMELRFPDGWLGGGAVLLSSHRVPAETQLCDSPPFTALDDTQLGNVLQQPPGSLAPGLLSPQLAECAGRSASTQTRKRDFARFLWGWFFPAGVIYETRASSSLCRTSLPSWPSSTQLEVHSSQRPPSTTFSTVYFTLSLQEDPNK